MKCACYVLEIMNFAFKTYCCFFVYFSCIYVGVKSSLTLNDIGNFFSETINPVKVVQRTIDDDFKTAKTIGISIAEGVPLIGHGIATAHLANGNTEEAQRVAMNANSNTGAILLSAMGTLCGPAAVVCIPALALIGQTSVDTIQSVAVDKPTGNIEYFVNFKNKSGFEHAMFGGSILLDALTGRAGGQVAKKISKDALLNDKATTGSMKNIAIESVKYDLDHVPKPKISDIDTEPKQILIGADRVNPHEPMDIDVPNQRHLDDIPIIPNIENSDIIPYDIQLKYYNELVAIKNEKRFKLDNDRLQIDVHDLYTQTEMYTGPVKQFYEIDFLKVQEDKCLKYFKGDLIATLEYKKALKIKAAYIKTDPRSVLFSELFEYSDMALFNVKISDLLDVNVGATIDEASTNCARLSLHKVFGLEYDKMTSSVLRQTLDGKLEVHYMLNFNDMEAILKNAGKEFNIRGYPYHYEVQLHTPERALKDIKDTMINKNLNELYGVCTIYSKVGEGTNGHAMTIRATLDRKQELSYMITDFQIQASDKIPHFIPSTPNDAIRIGKRFKQLEDLFDPNIGYQFFSYIY